MQNTLPKPDLIDAYSQIEWAERQTEIITGELATFIGRNPYRITSERNPNGPGSYVFLELTEGPPPYIRAPIATAIQSLRTSLDYLAVALAKANGATNDKDVYFPVCDSQAGLAEKPAIKKLKRLDPAHREAILALKPYRGGHKILYALHWLNIESKHRRLNVIGQGVSGFGIGGNGYIRQITMFDWVVGTNNRTKIAFVDADPNIKLDIRVDITFDKVAGQSSIPVVAFLNEASAACRKIVRAFE